MNKKILISLTTIIITSLSNITHADNTANCNDTSCVDFAIGILTKSCDEHGQGDACALMSQALYYGLGVERNLTSSLHYSKNGCDDVAEPSGASCNFAGLDYDDGIIVSVDETKAHSYYLKGCKLDSGDACWNAAYNYEYGVGVSESIKLSQKYYRKACKLGDEAACDEL